MRIIIPVFLLLFLSCRQSPTAASVNANNIPQLHPHQEAFWQALKQMCGNAYEGTVISAPANDTTFSGKKLYMHVRSCIQNTVRIPFVVGNDLSRTWVLTRNADYILLKHDHRNMDGSSDSLTMYGGSTSNSGTPGVQFFSADQETVDLLPAAGGNVWWIELKPGESFTYNLRRLGTDRLFSIRFDLAKTVEAPPPPWGS